MSKNDQEGSRLIVNSSAEGSRVPTSNRADDHHPDERAEFKLHMDALSCLRTEGERVTYLKAFALAMSPDRIDPAIWIRWLSGGAGPYETPTPTRPPTHGQSLSRDLQRQSRTVSRAEQAVSKAREKLDRAQAGVDDAEAELIRARADDKASLQAAVYERLRSEMEPLFAMGPAWTIMRALSGTVSPEDMEDELRLERNPEKRSALEDVVRKERRGETEEIMQSLWSWTGDREFERELRDAIYKVVIRYKDREAPLSSYEVASFRRASAVPGDATRDRDDTLAGFG